MPYKAEKTLHVLHVELDTEVGARDNLDSRDGDSGGDRNDAGGRGGVRGNSFLTAFRQSSSTSSATNSAHLLTNTAGGARGGGLSSANGEDDTGGDEVGRLEHQANEQQNKAGAGVSRGDLNDAGGRGGVGGNSFLAAFRQSSYTSSATNSAHLLTNTAHGGETMGEARGGGLSASATSSEDDTSSDEEGCFEHQASEQQNKAGASVSGGDLNGAGGRGGAGGNNFMTVFRQSSSTLSAISSAHSLTNTAHGGETMGEARGGGLSATNGEDDTGSDEEECLGHQANDHQNQTHGREGLGATNGEDDTVSDEEENQTHRREFLEDSSAELMSPRKSCGGSFGNDLASDFDNDITMSASYLEGCLNNGSKKEENDFFFRQLAYHEKMLREQKAHSESLKADAASSFQALTDIQVKDASEKFREESSNYAEELKVKAVGDINVARDSAVGTIHGEFDNHVESLTQQFEGLSTDVNSLESKVSTLHTIVAELSTTIDSFSVMKGECQEVVSGLTKHQKRLAELELEAEASADWEKYFAFMEQVRTDYESLKNTVNEHARMSKTSIRHLESKIEEIDGRSGVWYSFLYGFVLTVSFSRTLLTGKANQAEVDNLQARLTDTRGVVDDIISCANDVRLLYGGIMCGGIKTRTRRTMRNHQCTNMILSPARSSGRQSSRRRSHQSTSIVVSPVRK